MLDLVIKNGRVYSSSGFVEASVGVGDGKVALISNEAHMPSADRTIDAKRRLVLPGMIDMHVHFRDPGFPSREDFESGTKAAAAGGFTLIMDMPNTNPATVSRQLLREKIELAEKKAVIDFTLCGGIGYRTIDEAPAMADEGVPGFKTFMTSRFPELSGGTDSDLLEIFWRVAKTGLKSFVHAESEDIVAKATQKLRDEKRTDPLAFAESRPPLAEALAVQKAIILAREAKTRLHVCHLSASQSLSVVEEAKRHGGSVTAETCPQFLFLSQEALSKHGPYAKCDPPLRPEGNSEALWDGLRSGKIDAVATDHAPYTDEEKSRGWADIFDAPSGISSIQVALPLLLDSVNKGKIDLEMLVRILSENPAKILGLFPRKGCIQVGSDADFVIVDMNMEHTVKKDQMLTKQKNTPYEGWRLKGKPLITIVHGAVKFEDGAVTGKPGSGKFVRCESTQDYT